MFPSRQEIINYLSDKNDPKEILSTYFDLYKNLPKQGSDDWLKTRKIGGSSVAPILGIEKFATKKKIAENLLFSSQCEENKNKNEIAMNWGTVFEEAAKLYLSRFINIYEFGSLPGYQLQDGTEATSYSPDGIFIITQELLDFFVHENSESLLGKLCLLEIKCPFMRKITEKVPEYYLPQIQLGMHTVNFTDHAFYTEFAFRICSLSDLNFSSSCSCFTNNGIYDYPKAIGFFGFIIEDNEFKTKIIPNEIDFNFISESISYNIHEVGQSLREIESIYKNISEIEKFAFLQKKYNNKLVSEIFRVNYPKYDGIDFGGTLNFLYETTEISDENLMSFAKIKIREGNYFASNQLTSNSSCQKGGEESENSWNCREFFSDELEKLKLFAQGKKTGIICYKLLQVENNYIEKKPFDKEISTILDFAQQIEDIKKKSIEEQKKIIQFF